MTITSAAPTRSRLSTMLALIACLVAAGVPLCFALQARWTGALFEIALSYTAVLLAAGVLVLCRSRGAQLLARSIWWSALGAGVLVTLFAANAGDVARPALVMVLATSTSLLASGRSGLRHDDRPELAPAAYPRAFMVSMIMALADAQALGWLASTMLYTAMRRDADLADMVELRQALAMLACCAVALSALYGLYRLRLWGLVLSAATTVAIGVLSFTPWFGLRDAGPIPYAFAASAAIQLALLAPLFLAILRRRAPTPASPRAQRVAAAAPAVVIIALAVLSVITVATSHALIRF
jgi:hypothetical protein